MPDASSTRCMRQRSHRRRRNCWNISANCSPSKPPSVAGRHKSVKPRAEQALPLLAKIKTRFEDTLSKISGKSSLAQAIRYPCHAGMPSHTIPQTVASTSATMLLNAPSGPWPSDAKTGPSAGSDTGGERAATLYTIIETAKLSGIDPEAYLRSLIVRIASHPAKRIDELLPWNTKLWSNTCSQSFALKLECWRCNKMLIYL